MFKPSSRPASRSSGSSLPAAQQEEGAQEAQESSPNIAQPTSPAEVPPQIPEAGGAPTTPPLPATNSEPRRSVLPFRSDLLNSQAIKQGGEVAGQIIHKVALAAKLLIDTQKAKRPPPIPPPGVAAQNSGLRLDSLTTEQHLLEFDPAGQRERLEIQLHKVSDPTGRLQVQGILTDSKSSPA